MVRAGERQSRDGSQRLVIVTVAYHSQAPLEQLAADLARQQWQPERWLLVNNAPLSAPLQSQALALALALALAGGSLGLQLLEGEEGAGFGDGCNRAFTALAAEGFNGWVWLLNPDTSLRRGDECARLIAQLASLDRRSVVGTAVQASSGELEASGGWFDPGLRFRRRRVGSQLAQRQGPLAVDWLSGCSLVLQPEAHQPPARFDPAFPLYYEDLDLCLRLGAQGAAVLWLPQLSIGHQRGAGSHTPSPRRLRLSTISYLQFLRRHCPPWVQALRTARLLAMALLRLPFQPQRSLAVLGAVISSTAIQGRGPLLP
jgi:GT2 family glycosyltransferase